MQFNHLEVSNLLIKSILFKDFNAEKPQVLNGNQALSNYWDRCKAEATQMSTYVIGKIRDRYISLNDFLTEKDDVKLVLYMSNKQVLTKLEELQSNDYQQFPIFVGQIQNKITEGKEKKILHDRVKDRIRLVENVELLEDTMKEINQFLDHESRQNLLQASVSALEPGAEDPRVEVETQPGSSKQIVENRPSPSTETRQIKRQKLNFAVREPISIFKKEENQLILNELRNSYPENLKLGAALKTGDCFFDAVAQGLNELRDNGLIENNERFTVKSLREDCANYAKQHNDQNSWVYKKVIGDANIGGYFVARENVVYGGFIQNPSTGQNVIEESGTFNKYLEEIKNMAIEGGPIPILGRLDIEGKMICEKYKVKIEVIELTEKPVNDTHITSSERGEDNNVIRIVNYKHHFVPFLSNIKEDIKEEIRVSNKEIYYEENVVHQQDETQSVDMEIEEPRSWIFSELIEQAHGRGNISK